MQLITGCQMPSASPDVVDTSIRVLHVYAMSQSESGRRENEDLLIDAAADCVRDYVLGVGRFGPPPPQCNQQTPIQIQGVEQQQLASYLETIMRMNQGGQR